MAAVRRPDSEERIMTEDLTLGVLEEALPEWIVMTASVVVAAKAGSRVGTMAETDKVETSETIAAGITITEMVDEVGPADLEAEEADRVAADLETEMVAEVEADTAEETMTKALETEMEEPDLVTEVEVSAETTAEVLETDSVAVEEEEMETEVPVDLEIALAADSVMVLVSCLKICIFSE